MSHIVEELSHADDRAIIVSLEMPDSEDGDLAEFRELVTSAGVQIEHCITGSRQTPHHKYFLGYLHLLL